MKLTDVATIVSSRSRITIGDAYRLLKYFKYFEESYATKQILTDVIMSLSDSGYDQVSIKEKIKKTYEKYQNIESILDNQLSKKESDGPSIRFNINEESIDRLSKIGLSARIAGKSFRALTEKLIKTQQFSPDPKMIPIPPQTQRCIWTFKGKQCGYEGAGISCNSTYPACVGLGNQKNFGGFSDKSPGFAQGGMIDKNEKFQQMDANERLKQLALGFENSILNKIVPSLADIYSDVPDLNTDIDINTMWIDEAKDKKVQTKGEQEAQEIPEGIPESDWNALSYSSQQIILKRLGYNKKDIKNKNRAIDL